MRQSFIVSCLLFLVIPVLGESQTIKGLHAADDGLHVLVVGDWGRNGEYHQHDVAAVMGRAGRQLDIDAVVSVGDNFYPNGVASTTDPHWTVSFEHVYSAHSLFVPWIVALGNHDYRGSVQAQIDYTKVSRRWYMPSRYFVQTLEDDGVRIDIVVIDTNPFQSDYRADTTGEYGDVAQQDTARQLFWLDSVLSASTALWKIVIGHHPMYTGGKRKGKTEDMLRSFAPLFERHGVHAYFAGHEHDLQHHWNGKGPHYFVSGAGSEVRPTGKLANSLFASSTHGFASVALSATRMTVQFVDYKGSVLHHAEISNQSSE
jgi:tartrate-resistant acid phosphatase type 5